MRRLSIAAVVLVAGCTEVTSVENPQGALAGVGGEAEYTADMSLKPLADIQVEAIGPVRPGAVTPFRIRVSGSAQVRAGSVEVFFPDFRIAHTQEGRRYAPRGPHTPAVEWTVDLRPGSVEARTIAVTLPREGYYRVAVRLIAHDDADLRSEGVRAMEVVEYWILVAEQNGRVTRSLERGALPPGVSPQPGPFYPKGDDAPSETASDDGITAMGPWVCSGAYCGWLRYTDYAVGADLYVGPAKLWVSTVDVWTGSVIGLQVVQALSDGEFVIPACPDPGTFYEVNIFLDDDVHAKLIYSSGTFYLYPSACGSGGDVFVNGPDSRYYSLTRSTAAASKQKYGHSAPRVQVLVGSQGSYYNLNTQVIYLQSSEVWWRGHFLAGHEYGHYMMDVGLGRLIRNHGCPMPHPPYLQTSATCAYNEGFATAHGLDIWGAVAHSDYSYYESWTPSSGVNGSIVEGAVAAYLLDVVDPPNDDQIQLPSTYLAQIVQSCSVLVGGVWRAADGVDYLHYCMEKNVDPVLAGQYFTARPQPVAQSSGGAQLGGPTIVALRQAMRWNLFANNGPPIY